MTDVQPPDHEVDDDASLAARVDRLARENRALFERLLVDEHRFRRLARSAWRIQEAERRRLARDLHDGLGQELTALKIRLERLAEKAGERSELTPSLAGAVEAAARALADARRLSHQLRPRMLDDLGLVPALAWLARTLGEGTGFEVRFERHGIDEERLDPEAETLFFRVAQEALSNALRHSGADGAAVELERATDGRLRLTVRDAGRGFDPASAPGGDGGGLSGMRDRVELFGGRFTIDTAPGRGTAIAVELGESDGEAGGEG